MQINNPIITAFTRDDSSALRSAVENAIHDLNLTVAPAPQTPSAKDSEYSVIQFETMGLVESMPTLRHKLDKIAATFSTDLVAQSEECFRDDYRLACFDMDSTLIKVEVIDEIAKSAGIGEQVAKITAQAMRGELDFRQSFTARMTLLNGIPEKVLQDIADCLPLMDGAEALMRQLHERGIKTAILSGGFTYFAMQIKAILGMEYVHANVLEISAGKLTGRVIEPLVDGARKATLLSEMAKDNKLDLRQTIAVGDGANDLPMLNRAGLGVAFHAKPKVQYEANYALNIPGLEGLIYLIGRDH